MNRTPVVTFVGKSNSGKTTFLEKVIACLTERGYCVATVKHHAHTTDVDTEKKDSWRHARAGSVVSMVSSPTQFSVVRQVEREVTMEECVKQAQEAGCDILLAEGFKKLNLPKIELSRKERSDEPICDPDEVEAFVTNNPALARKFADTVPVYDLNDSEGFCNFLARRFIEGQRND